MAGRPSRPESSLNIRKKGGKVKISALRRRDRVQVRPGCRETGVKASESGRNAGYNTKGNRKAGRASEFTRKGGGKTRGVCLLSLETKVVAIEDGDFSGKGIYQESRRLSRD